MVQIIEENRLPSGLEKFMQIFGQAARGAAEGGQALKGAIDQKSTRESLARQFGQEFKDIRDPNVTKQLLSHKLQGRENEENFNRESAFKREMENTRFQNEKELLGLKIDQKTKENIANASAEVQEKVAPLVSGLKTIERMEAIGKEGNLGFQFGLGNLSENVRRDRAEYEQLGKSLISLASPIIIRNKQEFETLGGELYNPNATDAARKGTLNAMKRIISQNLENYVGKSNEGSSGSKDRSLEDIFG